MIRPGPIRTGQLLLGFAVVLMLAGCSSAPLHYYTLVTPATDPVAGGAMSVPAFASLSV